MSVRPMTNETSQYAYLPHNKMGALAKVAFAGFDPAKEMLLLRTSSVVNGSIVSHWSNSNGKQDFFWPKVGHIFFVGKFDESNTCGSGLHAVDLASPNTFRSIVTPKNAVWQLIRVKRSDAFLVTANGTKVKFKAGHVVLTTNRTTDIADVVNAVFSTTDAYAIRRSLPSQLLATTLP